MEAKREVLLDIRAFIEGPCYQKRAIPLHCGVSEGLHVDHSRSEATWAGFGDRLGFVFGFVLWQDRVRLVCFMDV